MYCCSSTKNKAKRFRTSKTAPRESEVQKLKAKYRFSEDELIEFRNRLELRFF